MYVCVYIYIYIYMLLLKYDCYRSFFNILQTHDLVAIIHYGERIFLLDCI
jgi:hypothetical protein